MDRLAEIRARWTKANWEYLKEPDEVRQIWHGTNGRIYRHIASAVGYANGPLIAAAPADIAYLLSLADALARLVETEPLDSLGPCCAYCQSCRCHRRDPHASACPWRQARELLARPAD